MTTKTVGWQHLTDVERMDAAQQIGCVIGAVLPGETIHVQLHDPPDDVVTLEIRVALTSKQVADLGEDLMAKIR